MDPQLRQVVDGNHDVILAFGPQVPTFDKKFVDWVRNGIATGPQFLRDTVASFPKYWDLLITEYPEVAEVVPGPQIIEQMNTYLQQGLEETQRGVPNMVISPLGIIGQFLQYLRYLEIVSMSDGITPASHDLQASWLARRDAKAATLGFCGGLFMAFAVASARTQKELEAHVSATVLVAFLMGAMAEADEIGNGRVKSVATFARNEGQSAELRRILDDMAPGVYVQARFDDTAATICVAESSIPAFTERMKAAGLMYQELDVHGRVHNANEQSLRAIEVISKLSDREPAIRLPNASELVMTTYDNMAGADPIAEGSLHEIALQRMLTMPCDWYDTFGTALRAFDEPVIVTFGEEHCVPRSMMRELRPRVWRMDDFADDINYTALLDHIHDVVPAITVNGTPATTESVPAPLPTPAVSTAHLVSPGRAAWPALISCSVPPPTGLKFPRLF